MGFPLSCSRGQKKEEKLLDYNVEFGNELIDRKSAFDYFFLKDLYPQLLNLWRDPKIQEIAYDPDTYIDPSVLNSAKYWFQHIDRIFSDDYIPTFKDILFSRYQTTGIVDLCFDINGYKFKLSDMGGARSERKKWVSFIHNSKAIIFVMDLSEYDQTLYEDSTTNRLFESIKVFRAIMSNDALQHLAMILIFNKEDLFMEKIKRIDLKNYFPEYRGEPGNKEQAFEFIKNQFLSSNPNPNRKIYTQVTIATDTDSLLRSMDLIIHIIIDHVLNEGKASNLFS